MTDLPTSTAALTLVDERTWTVTGDIELVFQRGPVFVLDHGYVLPSDASTDVDDEPWHGAAHYYEYPNVYAWVLFHEYLGVRPTLTADLRIAPRLVDFGAVTLGQAAYQLRYEYSPDGFLLQNLAPATRTFELDLTALDPRWEPQTVVLGPGADFRQ